MIKVVYINIESKIKINGLLSDPLTLVLVLQGCLLSMPLYKIHICYRVGLSLRGKKLIVNQILFFKLWYKTYVPKYIKKGTEKKKQHTICPATGKNTTSHTPCSTLYLERRTRYFRHKHIYLLEVNHILRPDIWGKTFTDWFKKYFDW